MDTQSETTLAILISSWHLAALHVTTSALKKLKAPVSHATFAPAPLTT